MAARLQFILRHRDQPWGYDGPYGYQLSSGLRNSVRFVVEMLHLLGIAAEWVEVTDAHCIDREVTRYKPEAGFGSHSTFAIEGVEILSVEGASPIIGPELRAELHRAAEAAREAMA